MDFGEPEFSKTICDETGRTLQIDYFVTGGYCETEGAQGSPVFGISAQLNIDGKCSDKVTVADVSPSREIAVRITQLLARNLVTPMTLKDVVEDCLSADF